MKTEFYKKNDEQYLALGFTKEGLEDDPMFYYKLNLIEKEVIEEYDLDVDDIPCLLIGNTGLNKGVCLSVGDTFTWISVNTPEEAIEWSKKIKAFESN